MNTARCWSGTVALASLVLSACGSHAPRPPAGGTPPVALEILRRDQTGALVGVPGIPVHRNDPSTGAFIQTVTTDTSGRADFGVVPGPVTLSVVRPPPAGGGSTRAYTLLGLPAGTAKLRLDRLPGEPGTVLSTVDVALSPPLTTTQRASVCLPTGCQGNARPGDAVVPGVVVTDQDLQDDGRVSLLSVVEDDEMGTAIDCRLAKDLAVPAAGSTVPGAAGVAPDTLSPSGALALDRVVALRKGVAFFLRPAPTCAVAFTDAEGFSVQGSTGAGGAGSQQVANYFQERDDSVRRGARLVPGPALGPASAPAIPDADAAIVALSYGAGTLHFTLQGSGVRSLVASRATLRWTSTVGGTSGEAREWHVYGGLAVGPVSCDGTGADPACTIDLKLPDLSDMGLPPDQGDGETLEVEAVAPAGASSAADFWNLLAAQGDAEAVLARGFTGAWHASSLRKLSFVLDVGPYARPGWLPLGKVLGSGGIDCSLVSGACTATLAGGSPVTLTAVPNSGAELVGWVGCGGGATPSVSFELSGDTSCTPRFQSIAGASHPLDVAVISTGNGLITSQDGFITCGYDTGHVPHSDCHFNYGSGTMVMLQAYPSDSLNAYDAVWSGDCAGSTTATSLVMDAAKTCAVEFKPRP